MVFFFIVSSCIVFLHYCGYGLLSVLYGRITHAFGVGKRCLSDEWALDTAQKPYRWQRLEPEGDKPSARV